MQLKQESYKQILKATTIFGGVQVFNMIIAIMRSKVIAVLLGPLGYGIVGILTSTISLIGGITNFGLGTSSIKDVAIAHQSQNENRIATVIIVVRRLVWLTGTLGGIVMLVLAPLLSQLTFGNNDYKVTFYWISISLLFNQLSSGQLVILQGLRKIQYLAKASLLGSVLGLLIVIPLYYVFGVKGIVPAIILSSFFSLFSSWFYAKKIKSGSVKVSRIKTIANGKNMLVMGFLISISGFFTTVASFIVRVFISNNGGVDQVGLYTAGFAIISTYFGLIFTAMSTDYYPRLSSVSKSNNLCKNMINEQAEVAILILAPILIFFIVFIKWAIIILYSNKFTLINDMILWASLGLFFKAATWSIGFILLAKGASKLYFWCELIGNIYMLGLNIVGYYFMGLTGLGISFLVGYMLYLVQVYILSKFKFEFSFDKAFLRVFFIQFLLAITCFMVVKFAYNPFNYVIGISLIIISTWYSIHELNKRLGFGEIWVSIKKLRKYS